MKNKIIYVVTIILSVFIGVAGTITTIHYFPITNQEEQKESIVKTVSITETNSIGEAVNKIYNSVVVIEVTTNRSSSSGSGFVYKVNDKNGFVITNHHVVESALGSSNATVNVVNMDGVETKAKILGSDEYADIAVLSIDVANVMEVAEIGNSTNLELGDTLFTVGTPVDEAYRGTVTKGILSGKDRMVSVSSTSGNGGYMMSVLQTDAAINPGNSGGPLVNINGEVIGVNTLKLVEDEIEGMGFAIPIELAMASVEKLEKGESIDRPLVGVSLLDVDNTYALYMNRIILDEKITYGAVIVEVEKGSVADKGGLKSGDVIIAIDEEKIEDTKHFQFNLYKHDIGDKINVAYIRDGKEKTVTLTLTDKAE